MRKVKGVLGGCVFIILVFLLSECKKTGKKEFVELDTDSAMAVHFNFKPGTYWIYMDSLSGRIDSFYVRNNYYTAAEEAYEKATTRAKRASGREFKAQAKARQPG